MVGIINGAPKIALGPAEQSCVALLEQILASARNGGVSTVCVVACGPADFGMAMAGPDAARLNLGLDTAKATILQQTSQPQNRRPTILHARPMG